MKSPMEEKGKTKSLEEEVQDINNIVLEEETRISKFRRIILPNTRDTKLNASDQTLLRGKTLQVYWYLFENGPMGVRDIQRGLNYKSPGIITYQIKKLSENGLISKDEQTDKYSVNRRVKAGLLHFYIKIGSYLVPRFSLYLLGFLIGFLLFLLGVLAEGDSFITHPSSLLLLLLLILGTLAFTYESRKMWKLKPY